MSIEKSAQKILKLLDDEGRSIPLSDWIELLSEVLSETQSRLDAAREDERRG